MPDLSLFKPLCDELDITINDLMSGEIVDKDNYQDKFEENVIDTLTLEKKKKERNKNIFLVVFGLFCVGFTFYNYSEDNVLFYLLDLGMMIFYYGLWGLLKNILKKKPWLSIIIVITGLIIIIFLDFLNVRFNYHLPIIRTNTTYFSDTRIIREIDGIFYKVIRLDQNQNIWIFRYKNMALK